MNTKSERVSKSRGHRWFAASYDFLTRGAERQLLARLRTQVVGEASGDVLEVGVGTGANFPYYFRVSRLAGSDPDPFMLSRAQRKAAELDVAVQLHISSAEALPFPDASFDTVVSTLVLCTVDDVPGSLAEVRRVLKPGGNFRFIEHVRGEGVLGKLHDVMTPAWRWVAAGCNLNRNTAESLAAAGFELVELQHRSSRFMPIIYGVASPRV